MTAWKTGDRVRVLAPPGDAHAEPGSDEIVGRGATVAWTRLESGGGVTVCVRVDGDDTGPWLWWPECLEAGGPPRPALSKGWRWRDEPGAPRRSVAVAEIWRKRQTDTVTVTPAERSVEIEHSWGWSAHRGAAPIAVVLACIADAHPEARDHLEAAMAAIGGIDG